MTWKEFNCMWSLSLPYCWLYRVKTYRSLGKDFSTKQNMWMECQECQTKTPFFRVCFFKRENNWFFCLFVWFSLCFWRLRYAVVLHCQLIFVHTSTSLVCLYLALVLAPSLRYATYLIGSLEPGRPWWSYHRHPQREKTLPSQSLPLQPCNTIFSWKSTAAKQKEKRKKNLAEPK